MSPEGPRFSPELDKDDKKDKKRKKNAQVSLTPLITLEDLEAKPTEKKEPSTLEKALADLAARRAETSEVEHQTEKPKQEEKEAEEKAEGSEEASLTEEKPETATEKLATELTAEDDHTDTDEKVTDEESYETLPAYTPEPTEFSGGEVVIHLNGTEPIAERVIPLQAETKAADTVEPSAESVPTPEGVLPPTPQPEEQPEPSHEEAPEPAAAGGGGEVPPLPPEYPRAYAEQPPEQPTPQEIYDADAIRLRDMAPFAPSSERPATKQDVEDALYYAEKAGQRRGVLAGLVAGGAYEHFKHKRRERKLHKQMKQQNKKLETARQNFDSSLQQQAAANAEAERRLNAVETAAVLPPVEAVASVPTERVQQPESRAPSVQHERRFANAEQEPTHVEQQQAESEQLQIPPEHRLETSAWHSIEVDARTGKPVENQSFEYGHEYHRERAHENISEEDVETAASAAGETALVGARTDHTQTDGSLQSGIPDATTQGETVKGTDKAKTALSSLASGAASSGPLWPWLLALLVVVILLMILL